jgi:hypothetical protein
MILTFAGSTHTKYMNYLLEMLCNLELESSAELREAFLANWIINPSGQLGHFVAGDKFQEQLQDEMYEHIGRKDRGFDESYMQKVIAPNAYRFVLVKKSMTEGLGLTQRSGKRKEPHTNAETRTLMKNYQNEQLHLYRLGRSYGDDVRKVDDSGRGVERLSGGKLASWVHDTTWARRLGTSPHPEHVISHLDETVVRLNEEASSEAKDLEIAGETQTRGRIVHTSDGELNFEFENGMDKEDTENDMEGLEEIRTEDTNIMMDIDYN